MECIVAFQDPVFLGHPKVEFPCGKGQIPFEQEEEFPMDEGPEYMRFLFDLHASENDQILDTFFHINFEIGQSKKMLLVVEKEDDTLPCVSGQKDAIDMRNFSLVLD